MSEQLTPDGRPLRTVKSFVRRQGRVTPAQEKALEEDWPRFGLTVAQGLLDWTHAFGRQAPVVFEIGCGNGEMILHLAETYPHNNYVGVEVHRPGVGRIVNEAARLGLDNLRMFGEDAIDVLKHNVPDGSLDGLLLFFPDPWHKSRHHKRRIVQPEFAQTVYAKLKPGGYFHMATDWENYAEHMMDVMSVAEGFVNQAGERQFTPRPETRPVTKFERRGERLGHGVWDLIFIRQV